MKKFTSLLLLVIFVLSLVSVPASAADYDRNVRGRITVEAEVPDAFNEIVFLSLMNSYGEEQSFAILPESNYILAFDVPCGKYWVSAYVSNGLLDYGVFVDTTKITVSQEADVFIKLSVVGGSPEATEDTQATDPAPSETEPEATAPAPTKPTEPPTEPSEPTLSDTEPGGEDKPSEPVTPTTPEKPDKTDTDKDDGRPFWQEVLLTVLGTAVFVGIVFLIAYLYRRHRDHI